MATTMGEPKYNEFGDCRIVWDGDLADFCCELKQTDPVDSVCPICGSQHIAQTDSDTDDFDTIINGYVCEDCGSEFSFTYWASAIYIRNDARFDKEA